MEGWRIRHCPFRPSISPTFQQPESRIGLWGEDGVASLRAPVVGRMERWRDGASGIAHSIRHPSNIPTNGVLKRPAGRGWENGPIRTFYDEVERRAAAAREITPEDISRVLGAYRDDQGQLRKRGERMQNGVFGATEVCFIPVPRRSAGCMIFRKHSNVVSEESWCSRGTRISRSGLGASME